LHSDHKGHGTELCQENVTQRMGGAANDSSVAKNKLQNNLSS
jgi:hypothetical protein